MLKAFDELPGWLFSAQEMSPMAYTVTGSDKLGHKVTHHGPESELPILWEKCLADTRVILERTPKNRRPPVTSKTFDDLPGFLFEIEYLPTGRVEVTAQDSLGHSITENGPLEDLDRIISECRTDMRTLIDHQRDAALKRLGGFDGVKR